MKAKDVLTGVAIGAVAGAVAGILFAPKSGKETREDIKKYMHEMKDKIADELSKAGDFTKETYNLVVKKVVGGYESAKKITSDEAVDMIDGLEKGFDKVKAKIKEDKK